jgi:hypothetical protein
LQFYLTLSLLVVGYAVGSCIYHATISDDLSLECLFFFLICGCAFIKKHWPLMGIWFSVICFLLKSFVGVVSRWI